MLFVMKVFNGFRVITSHLKKQSFGISRVHYARDFVQLGSDLFCFLYHQSRLVIVCTGCPLIQITTTSC